MNDGVSHRKYENHEVIMQMIFQNAAGYHADNHTDSRVLLSFSMDGQLIK